MGNFNAQRRFAAEQPARDAADAERRRLLDERFPPMQRPCGTPGAVYTVVVEGNDLGCTAHLPFDIASALPAEAAEEMKQALHDALLPIVETFYRKVWDQSIAGKLIADDPEPMPDHWEQLFSKWLYRCVNRGEMPTFEGRTIWSAHSIPDVCRRRY